MARARRVRACDLSLSQAVFDGPWVHADDGAGTAPTESGSPPRRARRASDLRRSEKPEGGRYFFLLAPSSLDRTAMKASCGTSTAPTIFIRFLPSFCFSSSLRLREMSPP
ncbi:hypothetical protein DSC45_32640 [Streptomyces sp. YIM 130001]|nr:hypothetical protein DSC45_32640 [Streptomyces sp. YIM 130001]